jgi:type I restriction enzyme, S subunit
MSFEAMHQKADCTRLGEKPYALGELREPANPDGWIRVPLSKLGRCFSGGTPSTSDLRLWGDDLPWVSSKDMKVSRLSDAVDHVTQLAIGNGTRLIQPGTLLIFPVAIAERSLTFNQDLKAFVTNPELYNEFLLYWLEANQTTILQLATDSTHGTKRISTSDL